MKKKSTKYLVDACLRTKELIENNRRNKPIAANCIFNLLFQLTFGKYDGIGRILRMHGENILIIPSYYLSLFTILTFVANVWKDCNRSSHKGIGPNEG